MEPKPKKKVLFICTHNSARSQMAEGLLNHFMGDRYEGYSAGTVATSVNPLSIACMAEIGVNIGDARSKHLNEFLGTRFDYVVTVCDNAKQNCPFFPGADAYIHMSFPDPSTAAGSVEEQKAMFTRSRDDIKQWLENTFKK